MVRRFTLSTAFPVVFVAALAACERSPADPDLEPPRAFTSSEAAISSASTDFGLELFAQVQTAASDPNVLVSPLSVSMALGMTANGAEDETLDAMRETLGYGGMPEPDVNAAYQGLIAQLRARDPGIEFKLANSVWHEQTFPVADPFLEAARTHFDAAVRAIDFGSPAAPGTISKWAEDATGGRIKDLIRSIRRDEVMFLVNAVYFKAPWSTPFDEHGTRPAPFTRLDGSRIDVQMMISDATRPFVRTEEIEAVELLYGDSAFSMLVVMPAEGRSLNSLISSLTPQRWQAWRESLVNSRVMVNMPKFRFDFGEELKKALTAMGMGIAFDPDQAAFGRITGSDIGLYISRVEHKTFIDVHELGTEAAAATAVGMGVVSMPPQLTFDRPFIFAILERSTGTLLFLGRVGDPTAD